MPILIAGSGAPSRLISVWLSSGKWFLNTRHGGIRMATNQDFRDLFAAFNDADTRYLLIGGYAVAFHAEPRYTKDLDIWVEPAPENAKRVRAALLAFGAPLADMSEADFCSSDLIFQIGVPPNRIDIVTGIDDVSFEEAWNARSQTTYADQSIHVIGLDHLIRNKRASGRPQDLLDVELLEKHRQEKA